MGPAPVAPLSRGTVAYPADEDTQYPPGIGTLRTFRKAGLTGRTAHQTRRLITGRVGYVRATSVNPAAENIATVPVKTADPPTREALSAATSTG